MPRLQLFILPDLSTASSASSSASSVHRRSTPKIAAVIIAAIIVIAGLVGVTVYLIDGERFMQKSKEVEVAKGGGGGNETTRMFNAAAGDRRADNGVNSVLPNGLDYQVGDCSHEI
jgi:hypothetical protein